MAQMPQEHDIVAFVRKLKSAALRALVNCSENEGLARIAQRAVTMVWTTSRRHGSVELKSAGRQGLGRVSGGCRETTLVLQNLET